MRYEVMVKKGLIWLGVLAVFDRLLKYAAILYEPFYKVSSFFSIHFVMNRGISFGLFHATSPALYMILNACIGCIIVLLAVHTYFRCLEEKSVVGESLVLVGAISNYLDRFWYDGVIDFLLLHWGTWHVPVFNVADIYITLGVCIMLYLVHVKHDY